MKYLIIGGSGMGGTLGGFLCQGNKDVTFMVRGENFKEIKENGLIIHSDIKGEMKIDNVNMYNEEVNIKYDVIFVCVKNYSLNYVIEDIKRVSNENTIVIPILSLFGRGESFAQKLPRLKVLEGCIYLFAYLKKYGEVVQSSDIFKMIIDGTNLTPKMKERLNETKDDLQECGIDVVISNDIKRDSFKNYCFISAYSTAAVYFNSSAGFLKLEGMGRELVVALSKEAQKLAEPLGIDLDVDIVEENMKILDLLDRKAYTALQKDIADGKRNELDEIIFEVVRLAEKYEIVVQNYKKISIRIKNLEGEYYVENN